MPRRIPPWRAPTLAGFLLRTAIHQRGLTKLADHLAIAEWSLLRYANGRRPHKAIREQLWIDLQIREIFWEIRLVCEAHPPICDDVAIGGENATGGNDLEEAGEP